MHRHEGPSRGKFTAAVTAAAVLATAAAGVLIGQYNERPPWGTDIAYEGGFTQASRIRGYDVDGSRTKALLAGECALMERRGMGGDRAVHDPAAWVEGCLDGAAGRPSRNQGIVR
ncbi:hypothetical protein [Streptomyces tanashiensis]|uniref:Uncharacterized protein n=1 Tax=Streptomyces tanashiensis TaxID=67367 RepID=A0ABY6R0F6_9ACTN|nr:hypothetical protein [Streptomyces tanashiensis]UZX23005.1 hypothetical protein LDH80_20765 [Streptomyces tanashiensis]GGY29701.1 hypothetical protein GCM10010299_39820 [Streptomyces tanashiensis]